MKKILYYLTLPFFTAVFYFMQLLEGAIWLVTAPSSAWSWIKEMLGI